MRALQRWCAAALTAGALTIAAAGGGHAEVKKAGGPERKSLDAAVYKALRDIINLGADLYNNGDTAGCYRLYEGSVRTLKPLLDHRPELQLAIVKALDDAGQAPQQFRRAFILREVIDKVRDETRPPRAAVKTAPKNGPSPVKTLWDRLGGEKVVSRAVDDFVAAAAEDPKVDFFRAGKYKRDAVGLAKLKKLLVELISTATSGPLTYSGRTMKVVHKGMGITNAEFDAATAHLKTALEKNGAAADDVELVLSVVAGTRKDVVEPKTEVPPPEPRTLWLSLGGEKNVTKVVDDFVAAAGADPKVNFFRDGKFKLDGPGVADLKKKLVDMISSLTGGPRKYTGKGMKDAHKGMGITDAEFDAAAAHLKTVLRKNGAKAEDVDPVMAAVESTRKAIVEPKAASFPPPPSKTLLERMGGADNLKNFTDDFVAAAMADPKVVFFRDGLFKFEPEDVADLTKKLVDILGESAGAPARYKGKKIADIFKGSGITDAEFSALAGHLGAVLEKHGAVPDDVKAVLALVEKSRQDIAMKAPEEKKAPEKKAEGKKK